MSATHLSGPLIIGEPELSDAASQAIGVENALIGGNLTVDGTLTVGGTSTIHAISTGTINATSVISAGGVSGTAISGTVLVGTTSVTTPSLVLGATAVTATAAEINLRTDDTATTETVIAAGALSVEKMASILTLPSGGAVTLAAPTHVAMTKVITSTNTQSVTLDLTNVVVGTSGLSGTTMTFSHAGDTLILVSYANLSKWMIVGMQGGAVA